MSKLNLTDEQKEKLRAGYRRALQFPAGFNMEEWACESEEAPCGTVMCYAGELCIAVGGMTPETLLQKWEHSDCWRVSSAAEEFVGVPADSLCDRLFYAELWPDEFADRYYDATTPLARAEALRDAVEDFIAKDGDW